MERERLIGVVADNAMDAREMVGIFAKCGFEARLYDLTEDLAPEDLIGDVVVVNTDSWLDRPAEAANKVRRVTGMLRIAGCEVYWKTTCSLKRGNVGAEFDAMLDLLGVQFGVVVADGPIHPNGESGLRNVLASQTAFPIGDVHLAVVREGAPAIRAALNALRTRVWYAVVTAETQEDMASIATAAADEPVLLGSPAVAEELSQIWSKRVLALA